MKTFFSKLQACWMILSHKEYAVFFTDKLVYNTEDTDDKPNAGCLLSKKVKNGKVSKIFREAIAEFILKNDE